MMPVAPLRLSLLMLCGALLAACENGRSSFSPDTELQAAQSASKSLQPPPETDPTTTPDSTPDPTPDLTPEPTPPADRPTVTLTITPEYIQEGTPVTLSWDATNAERCEASGGWQGEQDLFGAREISGLSETTRFELRCSKGSSSETASTQAVVTDPKVRWIPPTETTEGEPLENLAGYEVLYGPEAGNYAGSIVVDDPEQTELDLPLPGGSYYLAMVAYDEDDVRSDLSNEIFKFLGE